MDEKYKYFICYTAGDIYCNTEIEWTYINGVDDIREIEKSLQVDVSDQITLINYRIF